MQLPSTVAAVLGRDRGEAREPRTVLITGAASGLGLELAREFLAGGDRVICTDLYPEAPAAVHSLDGDWTYLQLDVTSDLAWEAASLAVTKLDILVCNAGIAVGGRIDKTSMDTWQHAIDINLLGIVRGCRTFVPKLPRGGQVVITASAAGLIHGPYMSTYNATKAGAVAIAETLDAELRPRGITTSVICPQFFRSGLADSLTGDDADADSMARVLLGRTRLTSELIAKRAHRAIAAKRLVITPDAAATFLWYSKRYARVPYLLGVRAVGRGIERKNAEAQANSQ
ncbi:SDR family NAD(P)-dependent oxidoreductase [Dietzia sp.]|uniref:SDR family NAD(P)-dependent oxidoreductase n=1 Tax=Dietzia sp. TaxID=1871616 RepID=UPI002FDA110D